MFWIFRSKFLWNQIYRHLSVLLLLSWYLKILVLSLNEVSSCSYSFFKMAFYFYFLFLIYLAFTLVYSLWGQSGCFFIIFQIVSHSFFLLFHFSFSGLIYSWHGIVYLFISCTCVFLTFLITWLPLTVEFFASVVLLWFYTWWIDLLNKLG